MNRFQFQFEDFALSGDGIHLLRNKFNFKTIGYDDIKKATIERSTEIRNALPTLIIGILMVCFTIYQYGWLFEVFANPHGRTVYIESIVLPIIPAFLGVYCIYAALKKGPMLRLEDGTRKYKLRLRLVIKNNLAPEVLRYLRTQLGTRLQVDNSMVKWF